MNRVLNFFIGKPSPPVTLAQTTMQASCTNCGKELSGHYCSACGEKKINKHDVTILHFIGHTFHEFTHLDSKLFKTFKYLFFRPGFLTEEFIAGHRKRYMNPIQLFIVANLFYFLFSSLFGINTFTTPLRYLITGPMGQVLHHMVDHKLAVTGKSYAEYEKEFDHEAIVEAKSLVIIMVPLFSMALSLLYYRQKRYFIEHLIFSLNFYSFILFGLNVLLILIVFIGERTGKGVFFNNDNNIFVCAVLAIMAYIFISLKRVYRESNLFTSLKTCIVLFLVLLIVVIYRILLFFTTFYGLKLSLH